MPTVNAGDFRASGGTLALNTSLIQRDVRNAIFYLEPQVAPLTMLLKMASKETARNTKYEWIEKERRPTVDQINNGGGYTAGATSIVVDNGVFVPLKSLIKLQRTNEVMLVTARTTNTLTVTRSWGGTAAAAINDNDYYTIITGAATEGDTAQVGHSVEATVAHNFTQIFREPFGITKTLDVSNLYGGKDIKNLTFEHGMYHKIAIEYALFEGERAEVTSGTMAQRSMGGMREFITTNTKDYNGVVTWEEIVKQAQKEFRYGNQDVRHLFAAPAVVSNIAMIAKDYIRTAPPASTFGIKMDRFTAQHGDYILIKENLFADGDELTKCAFSLDLDNIAYVPLNQRDTKLNKNIQANDADAVKHEWLTEATMRRTLEKTHGLWTDAA